MPKPRKELISLEATPYYHVVSRCVRRAFLCGYDEHTQTDYEYRRQWIVERIRLLASLFAIDIAAYAVMSNHLHLVVKINEAEAKVWSDDEVIQRWCALFKGPLLVQRYVQGITLSQAEQKTIDDIAAVWRQRLGSLSWFMKCLNEPIARRANKEDVCTGHFWESRYKSQALLTEEALLSCMAYVDLNPIRAQMAKTPETSDYTSIKERITPTFNLPDAIANAQKEGSIHDFSFALKPLLHFEGSVKNTIQNGILFNLEEYLTLVDTTGRIIREGKRGFIPHHLPPILKRLTIDWHQWINNSTTFEALANKRFSPRKQPTHYQRLA